MDADPTAATHDVDGRVRDGRGSIVLIEGLDGTGKSSLVKELYKTVSAPFAALHAGPPVVTTPIREYVWPLGLAAAGYTIVCDRWHLGEMVWPDIFGRESLIPDGKTLRHIEENMMYLRTPILAVYMNRNFADIRAELETRGELGEHLEYANGLYSSAMTQSAFDWHNTTLEKAHDMILSWLDDVQ